LRLHAVERTIFNVPGFGVLVKVAELLNYRSANYKQDALLPDSKADRRKPYYMYQNVNSAVMTANEPYYKLS
jgi:hypothetical protein